MISSKKIIVAMLFLVGMVNLAGAQRAIIKPDGFLSRLRAGGQAYMVPNIRIGQEALGMGMLSRVGTLPLTSREKFKYKAYEIGQRHLSTAILEHLVASQLVKAPFPAYYMDFEKAWGRAREKDHVTLRHLEVVLEAAYGEDTGFEGVFVPSFREALSCVPHQELALTARGALKQAFEQGRQKHSGFFVITVHATQEHPADVLLLDLKNTQFISVNKSMNATEIQ